MRVWLGQSGIALLRRLTCTKKGRQLWACIATKEKEEFLPLVHQGGISDFVDPSQVSIKTGQTENTNFVDFS